MNPSYTSTPPAPVTSWNDFNDAQAQQGAYDLIPKGSLVAVRMSLKPGGFDDFSQGWTGGYATQSLESGAVYLAAEFIVTAGPFAKRKLWSNIGLHSAKGAMWGQMGRAFIRAALNSARRVAPQDHSAQANEARRIGSFAELDGLEFLARVDVEKDGRGDERNVIKLIIEPDHKDYGAHMTHLMPVPQTAQMTQHMAQLTQSTQPTLPVPSAPTAAAPGKPAWAQ
jgi:hypothetical protein